MKYEIYVSRQFRMCVRLIRDAERFISDQMATGHSVVVRDMQSGQTWVNQSAEHILDDVLSGC